MLEREIVYVQLRFPKKRKTVFIIRRRGDRCRKSVTYRYRLMRIQLPPGDGVCGEVDVFR